jgi:hypothetical protein
MEAKELTELRDELQEAYTPIIPLRQWMFGESPCSKMISDMLREKGDRVDINCENLIEFAESIRPVIVWEMDEATFNRIKLLHDDALVYLWNPKNREEEPNTLLGYAVNIVPETCLRIVYTFDDGLRRIYYADF